MLFRSKRTEDSLRDLWDNIKCMNIRITEAEEQISDLEDRVVEFTAAEQNKEKRMKRIEDSLTDLWDNIKHNTRCTKFIL